MIATSDLIDALAADAKPVRRLRPPLVRAALWVAFATAVLALVVASHGLRPDLAAQWSQPRYVAGIAAALCTGILAAIGAFSAAVPGRSWTWLMLPAPAALAWIASIGYGCLTSWVELGPAGLRAGETARCFALLALTALPLALVILYMLRRAVSVRPLAVASVGSLAVAGFTATGLLLFHELEASALVLLLNLGTALLIVAIGGFMGRRVVDTRREL